MDHTESTRCRSRSTSCRSDIHARGLGSTRSWRSIRDRPVDPNRQAIDTISVQTDHSGNSARKQCEHTFGVLAPSIDPLQKSHLNVLCRTVRSSIGDSWACLAQARCHRSMQTRCDPVCSTSAWPTKPWVCGTSGAIAWCQVDRRTSNVVDPLVCIFLQCAAESSGSAVVAFVSLQTARQHV